MQQQMTTKKTRISRDELEASVQVWVDSLGAWERLDPQEAAARWGVTVKVAMKRLHAMVGGPIRIVPGEVEVYEHGEWSAMYREPRNQQRKGWDQIKAERLFVIPEKGAIAADLARAWNVSRWTAGDYILNLSRDGYIRIDDTGTRRIVFLTDKGADFARGKK